MRHIQVRVPDDQLDDVTTGLNEKDIDFIVLEGVDTTAGSYVVQFPLPTDAVGHILETLREAGIDEETYTIIGSVEAAMSPHNELLMNRYASDFDPISRPELRSKARDLAHDPLSYVALITFSAVIATVGLLVGSPAVIVGSMVIAPFVGPVLTAAVGSVTDDAAMLRESLLLQVGGVVVAIVVAALVSYVLRGAVFIPPTLDLMALESVVSRIAPNFLAVVVGVVAGGAAAYSLATKGPTALIGVMIAAALIPAAATVGIAIVWEYPLVALGTLLLLSATIVAINVGVLAVLVYLGYRPKPDVTGPLTKQLPARRVLVFVAVLLVVGAAVGVVTYQHVTFERSVNQAVHATLEEPRYDALSVVSTNPQYGGADPFSNPTTVTILLSHRSGESYPNVASDIARRIAQVTDHEVTARVRFVTYQRGRGEHEENTLATHPGGRASAHGTAPEPGSL